MIKGKEVIRITRKQKRILDSLKVNKAQPYHEVIDKILMDNAKSARNMK
jgi:hypothetical protein